ncbi:MAG TPA: hypothetical protein DDZ88_29490 [Verrucomicrobiales bacterium]|nr:hypothetical protein [Verrucomicrobiales bacterium]
MKYPFHFISLGLVLLLGACNWHKSLEPEALTQLYSEPLSPPDKPLRVFHIGHSLVNRQMPLMLENLAGPGHEHRSQLGWGASLKSHWEPSVPINGFEVENAHERYQDARKAVASGEFDVLVLTEAVEIKDSIKHNDSPRYIREWTRAARAANPQIRVYLYELWHHLNDPKGWLERLDEDLGLYWEGVLLAQGLAHGDTGGPVHVIPAGQVLGRLAREVEARGGVGEMRSREDLFYLSEKGERDMIHLSELGNFLVALTHYAVLYHRPPPVVPPPIIRADGTTMPPPSPELFRLMSEVVWSVVTSYPKTGVAQKK